MSGKNCYVVSYDIMNQKRLQKVHRKMKGFGEAIHYSVFSCDLSPKGKVEMIEVITGMIKHDEDRVMVIDLGPVDGSLERRIDFIGVRPDKMERKAIIV